MSVPKPVVLCILDGWGERAETEGNAPALAHTPNLDKVFGTCPKSTLITFGPDVGLPTGQMGNSEVGHTNIGAGRVVAMDLGQIDLAIEDGSFFRNEAILRFTEKVKAAKGRAHLFGMISDGGVHGHITHTLAACKALTDAGVPVVVHAITDGRDVAPDSAARFIDDFVARMPKGASVGTVIGRYWAMDRDNRWERVGRAYEAIVDAAGLHAETPAEAVAQSYAKKEMDEFIQPTVIGDYAGAEDGYGFFCLNFRADRAREILRALAEPGFAEIDVAGRPDWSAMLGMVEYSVGHNAYMETAYPKRDIVNTLAEWVSKQGLTQFHCAETEKYPHVTFFLNGGKEAPWPGEDRTMPKSPKVATYDLQPEMSAPEVTERFVEAIQEHPNVLNAYNVTGDVDYILTVLTKDLEEYAQQALMEGRTLPGWKLVQGRSTRKWTDQSGVEKYSTEIRADSLQMLGGRQDAAPATAPAAHPAPPPPPPRPAPAPTSSSGFDEFDSSDVPF